MQLYILWSVLFVLYVLYKLVFRSSFLREEAGISRACTDSMKALAIIGIMLAHVAVQYHGPNYIGPLRPLIASLGAFGVQVFFFLSGFGTYYSIQKTNRYLSWGGRHALRLICSFVICYVLTCLIYLLFDKNVFDIHDFVFLLMPYCTTWYLKIQILFYFFLVLAVWIFRRYSHNENMVAVYVLILSVGCTLLLQYFGFEDWWWKSNLCFALGIGVAINIEKLKLKINGSNRQVLILTFMAICVYIICMKFDRHWVLGPVLAMVRMLVIFCWFYAIRFFSRAKIISKYTLEIYLIHIGLIELFVKDVNNSGPVMLLLTFTLVASWLANKIVSRVMKWI